ncbi:MAG: ORF6N domain-containing protein, partial [Sphingobacteriaceae bacterium]
MHNKQDIHIIPDEVLLSKIYQIRGQKVMLDSDLAELYR